jgi:glutathione S-transferase
MIVSMHRRLHAADSTDDVFVCVRMQVVQPWVLLLDGTRTREEMSELVKQMLAAVVTLEGALAKGRPFFGGDSVGYVDVALGGLLVWVRATEALFGSLGVNVKFLDAARTPLLAAWAERFAELDAAKVALPDYGRLIKYTMMRRSAAASVLAPNNN